MMNKTIQGCPLSWSTIAVVVVPFETVCTLNMGNLWAGHVHGFSKSQTLIGDTWLRNFSEEQVKRKSSRVFGLVAVRSRDQFRVDNWMFCISKMSSVGFFFSPVQDVPDGRKQAVEKL